MTYTEPIWGILLSAFCGAFAAVLLTEIVRLIRSRLLANGVAAALRKELNYCRDISTRHAKRPLYYLDKNVTPRYPVELLQLAIQVFSETRWRDANQLYALTRFLDEIRRLNLLLEISFEASMSTPSRLNLGAADQYGAMVADTFRLGGPKRSFFEYAQLAAEGKKFHLDF